MGRFVLQAGEDWGGLVVRGEDGGISERNLAIAAVQGRDSLEGNVIKADPQRGAMRPSPHCWKRALLPDEFALTAVSSGAREPAEKGAPELTPFMRQWTSAKHQNPDALVFFRMGDFYELFYDDAAVASRELQLTLTARDKERNIPMCGVPYHAVEQYVTRLLRKGYRIALCDQMEDPKLTKKLVKREVTRVLTPGTALDAGLGQEQNNFLAALWEGDGLRTAGVDSDRTHPSGKNKNAARVGHPGLGVGHPGLGVGHPGLGVGHPGLGVGHPDLGVERTGLAVGRPERVCAVALLDVSTGEFRTMEFRGEHARALAIDALLLAAPSEVLMAASAEAPALLEKIPARTRVEDWVWTRGVRGAAGGAATECAVARGIRAERT